MTAQIKSFAQKNIALLIMLAIIGVMVVGGGAGGIGYTKWRNQEAVTTEKAFFAAKEAENLAIIKINKEKAAKELAEWEARNAKNGVARMPGR